MHESLIHNYITGYSILYHWFTLNLVQIIIMVRKSSIKFIMKHSIFPHKKASEIIRVWYSDTLIVVLRMTRIRLVCLVCWDRWCTLSGLIYWNCCILFVYDMIMNFSSFILSNFQPMLCCQKAEKKGHYIKIWVQLFDKILGRQ